VKLGVSLGLLGHDWARDLEIAQRAERSGLDSVWVSESIGPSADTIAAALAAATTTIGVGTAVLQVGTRTPTAVAMAAYGCASVAPGRFTLGVGLSSDAIMRGWHGLPGPPGRPLLDDVVGIVRAIAAGDRLVFAGATTTIPEGDSRPYRLRGPLPCGAPPVHFAALSAPAIAHAASVADGAILLFGSPVHVKHLSCSASIPTAFPLSAIVPVIETENAQVYLEAVRVTLTSYLAGGRTSPYAALIEAQDSSIDIGAVRELYAAGRRDEAQGLIPLALVDAVCAIGSRSKIFSQLDAWEASGLSTLIAAVVDPTAIELLASWPAARSKALKEQDA